jgi:EAL domain-containing protein (putative c-di-GMP-specific phosphodiesterase class I)/ActR/RegA family two-component response regulator
VSEQILIIDDDRAVADGLALLLASRGRTIIVCPDIESADVVLSRRTVTHIVCDVQFAGPFGFEGLHFLEQLRVRKARYRVVLMTGAASDALRASALQKGASAMLSKPFQSADLFESLGLEDPATVLEDGEVIRVPGIEDILGAGGLSTVFQPLVDCRSESQLPIGFEALTRLSGERDGGWAEGGIAGFFEYAARKNVLADLNIAALECALASAAHLPDDSLLFLNVDPETFERQDLPETLRAAAVRHTFPLSRIVLEITERSGFGNGALAARAFAELRANGIRLALDDLGSAHTHLGEINEIAPSFIKISNEFGTDFEKDATRTLIVRNIVALARDLGCRTVLEGIESASTARAAVDLGIEIGQGYYYGRPSARSSQPPMAA